MNLYDKIKSFFKRKEGKNEIFKNCNRFEVIDENGRSYLNYNCKKIEISLQDKGKTMKIFIT